MKLTEAIDSITNSIRNISTAMVDFGEIDINKLKFNYDTKIYVNIPYGVEIPELSIIGPMRTYLMTTRNILKYLDEKIDIEVCNKNHLEDLYLLAKIYNLMLEKRKNEDSYKYNTLKPLSEAIYRLEKMMGIEIVKDQHNLPEAEKQKLPENIFDRKDLTNDILHTGEDVEYGDIAEGIQKALEGRYMSGINKEELYLQKENIAKRKRDVRDAILRLTGKNVNDGKTTKLTKSEIAETADRLNREFADANLSPDIQLDID